MGSVMVRWVLAGVFAASALSAPAAAPASATPAAPAPAAGLRILESDASGIQVELTIGAFETETVSVNGASYQSLTAPGYSESVQPGAPQVPLLGTLLGLPTTDGVQVALVTADDVESIPGLRLAPAPTLLTDAQGLDGAATSGTVTGTFALDPRVYGADAFYPGPLVSLGQVGDLRDQAVAQLQFNPIQYNPVTGETRLTHHLVARLTWPSAPPAPVAPARASSPQFDDLLRQSLLNADSLPPAEVTTSSDSTTPAGPQLAATGTISPELKIGITSSGIYTLSYAALTAAGFKLAGVNPRTIKITNGGVEIPIQVIGEADGVFNSRDYVLFYGAAYDDVYTNVNVYWLEAGGANGLRMATPSGQPASAAIPPDFPVHLHAEVDQNYWSNLPDGTGQDHWFWGTLLSPPGGGLATYRDYSDTMAYPPLGCACLTLHNLATGPLTATVKVQLRGYTTPHHHTQISLNGHQIASQGWDGQGQLDLTSVVSQSLLLNGGNTVRVQAITDGSSNGVDQILVDWIEIDYLDRYIAVNNSLQFGPPSAGTWRYAITGYTQPAIKTFDITNPQAPALITSTVVSGAGPYTVTFQVTSSTSSRYLALTPAGYKAPSSIVLDQPSNWQSATNGADWIIITARDFYTEAVNLANLRQSQSLRVAVVDVQDLYDEFNNGIFSPQAIRDFLAYTYDHWQAPAPTDVVLLGDACQDFKNALWDSPDNACPQQFVPAPIYESNQAGEVPNDDWYIADFHGHSLFPDMFIGRISVQTAQQAHDAVAKIIQYDQTPPAPSWSHTVTLIAGGDDTSFSDSSNAISNTVPTSYTVNRLYFSTSPANPTGAIEAAFASGSLLVNYLGHGEYFRWGTYNCCTTYLKTDQIADFTNVNKLAVVTIGDCLNGDFSGPVARTSLAEYFQRTPNVGAVAVFAPSDLGYPPWHRALMLAFYQAIFTGHHYALGAAVAAAKLNLLGQNIGYAELVQTYILFGDPATTLGRSSVGTSNASLYLPLVRR